MNKLILAGTALVAFSPGAFAAPTGDAVIIWNANAGVAATKACIAPLDDPFHELRIYAMMHIAIHDALNAIDRKYQPYAYDKKADPGASPDAAVAAAAHDVLVPLITNYPESGQAADASRLALPALKPPTRMPLLLFPTAQLRRRVSRWDRLRQQRSSSREPKTTLRDNS